MARASGKLKSAPLPHRPFAGEVDDLDFAFAPAGLQPVPLSSPPYSSLCRIRSLFGANPRRYGYGTGFWVAGDRIVTAGHVLFNPDLGGYAVRVEVFGLATPDSSNTTALWRLKNYFVPMPFYDGSDLDMDVGVVAATKPASATALALKVLSPPHDPTGGRVEACGYPAPTAQAHADGSVITAATSSNLYHGCDVVSGLSGGPLFSVDAGGAVGVHVRGVGDAVSGGTTPSAAATRMTPAIVKWVRTIEF